MDNLATWVNQGLLKMRNSGARRWTSGKHQKSADLAAERHHAGIALWRAEARNRCMHAESIGDRMSLLLGLMEKASDTGGEYGHAAMAKRYMALARQERQRGRPFKKAVAVARRAHRLAQGKSLKGIKSESAQPLPSLTLMRSIVHKHSSR